MSAEEYFPSMGSELDFEVGYESTKKIVFSDEENRNLKKMDQVKFWYGKYKGQSLGTVVSKDASYVRWSIDNIPTFFTSLNDELKGRRL